MLILVLDINSLNWIFKIIISFEKCRVFPSHKNMFTCVNIGAYDLENFFYL